MSTASGATLRSAPERSRRMSRRALFALLAFAVLAALAALYPWRLSGDALSGRLGRHLAAAYGLDLAVAGRTTIALLPVPRMKLDGVALTDRRGSELLRDAQLRVELRILPLLAGRLEPSEVSVGGGRIAIDLRPAPEKEASVSVQALKDFAEGASRRGLRRLIVTGAELDLRSGPAGPFGSLKQVDLVLSWPGPGSRLDFAGSASWRGEVVQASAQVERPLALLAGASEQIDAKLSGRLVDVLASGAASLTKAPRFAGLLTVGTSSIGGFARWLGAEWSGRELDRPGSVAGNAVADGRGVDWSQLRMTLGGDRLDGALSVRAGEPLSVRATLAADRLDLGWLRPSLTRIVESWTNGRWAAEIAPIELDLRLSASDLRMAPLSLKDSASSLLVSGQRIDLSLLRGELEGGAVKGRLSTALGDDARTELKGQFSAEGLDAASVLVAAGYPAFLSGKAAVSGSFEASCGKNLSLLRQLSGRATLGVGRGDVSGLDVASALRQPEPRLSPPAAPRTGRTPFDRAQVALTLGNGIAEIVEGNLDGAGIRASLQGRVSLPDWFVSLRASASHPAEAVPGRSGTVVLDINGPLQAPLTLSSVETAPAEDGGRPAVTR